MSDQVIRQEAVKGMARLIGDVARFQAFESGVVQSTLNVSNPPTDAELTAEFGNAADNRDVIVINDNGAGANYWLITSEGSAWLYVALSVTL